MGLDDWGIPLEDKEKEYEMNKYFEDVLDEIPYLLGFCEDSFPYFIYVLNSKEEFKDFKNHLKDQPYLYSRRCLEKLIRLTLRDNPLPEHIKKCVELKSLLAHRKE